jgi:hypothetical protein
MVELRYGNIKVKRERKRGVMDISYGFIPE